MKKFLILKNKKGKSIINLLAILLGISFYLFTIINFNLNLYSDLYDYLIFLEIPIILIIITNLRSNSKKEVKKNKYYILLIYLVFLISLILINPIKGIILNGVKLYDYNLIPFKTISNLTTLISQFLMLTPLSILLPLINKKFKKNYLMLITLILTSLTFKGIEYLFLIGVFDIDEIILNIMGGDIIFLLIYKTKLIKLIKEHLIFKIKDKTLDIIYIILFIMLIFLGSNRVFAYIYQEYSLIPEVSGSIKCDSNLEEVGIIDGYKYYTKCHGNYNIIYNNSKHTLENFIKTYKNLDKYMDEFKLERKRYINDVLVKNNPLSGKELILKTPYENIYYYNIESIKVKVEEKNYDFKDYLNHHIPESLDLDYTFKNLEQFHSSKDNYTIYIGEYFNKLDCHNNVYLLPKNYKINNKTCNYLDKLIK